MSVEAIDRKYRDLGGESVLGPAPEESYTTQDGRVTYKVYSGGVIAHRNDLGAFVVRRASPPLFSTWLRLGACNGIGMPTNDGREIHGDGWFQVFEEGLMYWHPDLPRASASGYFIRNGLILDKWGDLQRETGPLGYPISDQRDVPGIEGMDNVAVLRQDFQHGTIMVYTRNDTGESFCFAIHNNGFVLPEQAYRLTLTEVICHEETDGLGSDEFNLSAIVTGTGAEPTIHRWEYGDFDSGERRGANLTLYEGPLPSGLNVSLLALEKDGPRAFRNAREYFEGSMSTLDEDFDKDRFLDIATGIAAGTGTLGAIIGFAVAGGTLTIGPAAVGSGAGIAAIFTGGGAVGGLIGLAVAAVVAIFVGFGLAFRSAEILVIDRTTYLGDALVPLLRHDVAVATDPEEFPVGDLRVTVRYERGARGQIVERRIYRNDAEDSTYELVFSHQLS